ncbi:MAG: pyridoxal phosphate-dependent decarboxylase family protein [Planctomycetota bacterium]
MPKHAEATTTNDTLDPADWNEFSALAHRALDDALAYLRGVRERPVWQTVPSDVRRELTERVPRAASDLAAVYDQFARCVLPYPTGNIHPRFWGWVMGTGTPFAVVAEMLASTMNTHVAGYDQSATLVEEQTVAWLCELMGFPSNATGVFVSGGTMANLQGLVAGVNAGAGFDVREQGLRDAPPLAIYASTQTHHWIVKACELVGLGRRSLRRIPVDAGSRMVVADLERAIRADRAAGVRPVCVVGTAGTVNTGATDDLAALAALCRAENVWFHVDGAFGALAKLSPKLAPLVRGIEDADSLAFDLHKWGFLPYGVGCTLYRRKDDVARAFASQASYIAPLGRGIAPDDLRFASRGIELSRPFRALKVWMSMKAHGVDGWARMFEKNVAQAQHLARLVEREPALELAAPVPMNIVCLRVRAPSANAAESDALNREVLLRVQESGVAIPSSTQIGGRFAIRVCITNHRTRSEDLDLFVARVLDIARAIESERR